MLAARGSADARSVGRRTSAGAEAGGREPGSQARHLVPELVGLSWPRSSCSLLRSGERDRLPLLFAAVLAVVFKPLVGTSNAVASSPPSAPAGRPRPPRLDDLRRGGDVRGVIRADGRDRRLGRRGDREAVDELDVDEEALEDARTAAEETSPAIAEGFVTKIVSGVDALIGLASGLILGALIMYSCWRTARARRAVVAQIGPAIRDEVDSFMATRAGPPQLRAGSHRDVRDRVGGRRHRQPPPRPSARAHDRRRELHRRLHPLHRRLPGRWACRDRRPTGKVVSAWGPSCSLWCSQRTCRWRTSWSPGDGTNPRHPSAVVLIVIALGGFLFGIVGLLLAVPFTVIAGTRSAASGERLLPAVADRAEPTVKRCSTTCLARRHRNGAAMRGGVPSGACGPVRRGEGLRPRGGAAIPGRHVRAGPEDDPESLPADQVWVSRVPWLRRPAHCRLLGQERCRWDLDKALVGPDPDRR